LASCGDILRDYTCAALGCLSLNIGHSFAFPTKLMGAMIAIELTQKWLEEYLIGV